MDNRLVYAERRTTATLMARGSEPSEVRAVTIGIPLDADHDAAVRGIRRRLGAPADAAASSPHLSLIVLLVAPPRPMIEDAIRAVAARTEPFRVRARGFGVFDDGDGPAVLHVPVVRTSELARLHLDLYETVTAIGGYVDGQYAPRSWFPHVTLWDRVPTTGDLAAAVGELADAPPLAWTLPVSSLALLDRSETGLAVPLHDRALLA